MRRGPIALAALVAFVVACGAATLVQGKGPACASFTPQAWAEARADRTRTHFARVNQLSEQLEFCDDLLVLGRSRRETRRLLGRPDERTDVGPSTDIYDIGYRNAFAGDSESFTLRVRFDHRDRADSVSGAA